MTMYKWVPEQFVDQAHRGKLRIGTLLGYSDIENGRNDDHEGFVSVSPENLVLASGEGGPARRALARMGIYGSGRYECIGEPGQHQIMTARADAYCFCMTDVAAGETLASATERQAVLEIANPEEFCRTISEQTAKFQFRTCVWGPVDYADYTLEGLDGSGPIDTLFTKRRARPDGYSFEGERENRALWIDDNSGIAGEADQPRLKPFFTRPTKQIARHLKRVA